MTYQAFIFDLDGTLVDSAPDIAAALNAVLAEDGLPAHPLSAVLTMVGHGVGKLIERGYAAHGKALDQAGIETRYQRFLAVYDPIATTRLYAHAKELLAALHDSGMAIALCTNKPERPARAILEGLDIAKYFQVIIGGDSGYGRKPSPRPVEAVLQALQVPPAEALFVGDSAADLCAARAAHCPVALLKDGYQNMPLNGAEPDIWLESLADLNRSIPQKNL